MKVFTETERFILREIVEEDVLGFFELDADPEVHKYIGNHPVGSVEECQKIIAHVRNQYIEYGMGRWAIIDKTNNDFLGWTGIKYETGIRKQPYYDLGYRIIRKHWGKGIATETAFASLEYGFKVGYHFSGSS